MQVSRYVKAVWKWSWLVVLATALAAGMTYRSGSRVTPVFKSTTVLLVGRALQQENPSPGDIQTSQMLAAEYAVQAKSQPVIQAAIDSLDLRLPWTYVRTEVSAIPPQNGEEVQISVADTDPRLAARLANEIAHQLIVQSPTPKENDPARKFTNQQMAKLQGQIKDAQAQIVDLQARKDRETSALAIQDLQGQIDLLQQKVSGWQNTYAQLSNFYQGSRTNYLSVVTPATVATAPVGTSLKYNVALAGGIASVLALGGVLLLEYLDDTVKSARDLDVTLGLPVIGGIGRAPRMRDASEHLIVLRDPNSVPAEACRLIGATLRSRVSAQGVSALLVTSPGPAEGKSTIAANLAIVFAQMGKRVVLIDASLRRPSLHEYFGLTNEHGLATLLLDETIGVETMFRPTSIPGLVVIPAGPNPTNPGAVLGSPVMELRLAQARQHADLILVDTPAVLGAAETTILGTMCDEVLLVVCGGRTRLPSAREATAILVQTGLTIAGAVINQYETGRPRFQHYYNKSATPEKKPQGDLRDTVSTTRDSRKPDRPVQAPVHRIDLAQRADID